jgi:uncharacterized protein (TIGR02453 family)
MFSPAAFKFLRDLKRNNRREWFEARRDIYENELRTPLRDLLEELDVRLGRIAPELYGDPKRSVFRIHRDTRFSKDKSPYKHNVGFWVNHRALGRSAEQIHGGAGLYFHFEPGASMIAGGIWMPPAPALVKIRAALAEDHKKFAATVRTMRRRFSALSEEAVLQRMPRGYDEDHPAARWLRYKSFTSHRMLSAAELRSPRLPDTLARDYGLIIPFVRWLNSALGLKPAASR